MINANQARRSAGEPTTTPAPACGQAGGPLDGRAANALPGGARASCGTAISPLKLALLAPALLADAYRPAMLGREPDAFQHVADNLHVALGRPVDIERILVADEGYDFIRNLAAVGPNQTMLLSTPRSRVHFHQGQDVSTATLRSAFSRMNLQVRSLNFAVNFANLWFERTPDLLLLALPASLEPTCSWVHPTLGCDRQIDALVEAFGSPRNILKFEPAKLEKEQCFDLDMFFFMLQNTEGFIALLHSPCVAQAPSSASAARSGVVGRAEFKRRLEELGITVVEVSKSDFSRRACNSISPQPGQIVFSEPVSKSLRVALQKLGVNVKVLPELTSGQFGIHCLTLELPQVAVDPGDSPAVKAEL